MTYKIAALFLVSLFFSLFEVNAQARLGYTKDAITEEFSDLEQEEGYTDEGKPYLDVLFSHGQFAYYFNEDGICDFCILIPKNDQLLHKTITLNNEDYVVVSDTEWKKYTDSGILSIALYFSEKGTPYFVYTVD